MNNYSFLPSCTETFVIIYPLLGDCNTALHSLPLGLVLISCDGKNENILPKPVDSSL